MVDSTKEIYQPTSSNSPENDFGWRHVQALSMFAGVTIAYTSRISMSVAIVSMRNSAAANPNFPVYDWDNRTSNLILSSFFWGYVVTQIPGGYLSRKWSAGKIMSIGMFVSSSISMLIPTLAEYGPIPVICCRVAMGLSQGPFIPCSYVILFRWAPPAERTRLSSFVANATSFGTLISMPISGVLAASEFGWPSIFYVFGAIGVTWSLLFYCTNADHPSEHSLISPKELSYISDGIDGPKKPPNYKEPPVPWKAILSSPPVLSIWLAGLGTAWGSYTFLTQLPTYMIYVLKFNISQSGMLSAAPYSAKWLLCFPLSYLGDFAIRKNVPTVVVRKISSCIGSWIPALVLLVLCVTKTNDTVIVLGIIIVAVGCSGAHNCGLGINCMDLTNNPSLIGILTAIGNCLGNLLGIITPYLCGLLITDESDQDQWFVIFYITSGLCFISTLIFVIFGSAKLQSWNNPVIVEKQAVKSP